MRTQIITIQSEADYREAMALASRLMVADRPEDAPRLRAQALVIQDYERRRFALPPASQADILEYLMEQHGMRQADMAPFVGSQTRVSEILAGKRNLSLAMIRRLSARFKLSSDVFLSALAEEPVA